MKHKPTTRQLAKRVKQLTRENELLQRTLSETKAFCEAADALQRGTQTELNAAKLKITELNRVASNLHQAVKELAEAAVRTNTVIKYLHHT